MKIKAIIFIMTGNTCFVLELQNLTNMKQLSSKLARQTCKMHIYLTGIMTMPVNRLKAVIFRAASQQSTYNFWLTVKAFKLSLTPKRNLVTM